MSSLSASGVEDAPGGLDFIVMTPPGSPDPALAIAASRAGAIGVLDLQFAADGADVVGAIQSLARHSRGRCGIKIGSCAPPQLDHVLSELPARVSIVILSPTDPRHVEDCIRGLRARNLTVLLEAISESEARLAEQAGLDGVIAKGNESGGRVGEETTFVLLQRLLGTTVLPVWAQGGIGLHSAAACVVAGAAGVVLDSQLALTRESNLPESAKRVIGRFDGSETICIGRDPWTRVRVFAAPDGTALAGLRRLEDLHAAGTGDEARANWWREAESCIGWSDRKAWPLGQEAACAASLGRRFERVAAVLSAFRESASSAIHAARTLEPLSEGSPLARVHGTRYPIVQGPMTRVADSAAFALRVAQGGALPFLALALMRAREVERLLTETRAALGARPWGVGILGFVPDDIRAEQLAAVRAAMPAAALIAGGRPDQAASLEQAGIPTYLHVPSPGLLKLFLESGARRFVFEGRECGGHVGPRGSFALWDAAVETLNLLPASDIAASQLLFAGGIHDARSAAMVAAVAAPLAERGAKIGVLLGTAYVFTHEAVATGAIVERFQQQALACRRTVLLTSGPGHSTRCAATPFADHFMRESRRLLGEGRSVDEARAALEALNLGRLRLATKGLRRSDDRDSAGGAGLVPADDAEQLADGMYMIGQVAALRDSTCSIEELHEDVSRAGSRWLERAATGRSVETLQRSEPRPFDIAVVGMSCLLPKAPDARTYWDNILCKVDAVTEVPASRWDWHVYYDPNPGSADKVNSKWGGFMDPVHIDPVRYGMPPNSLASIEPLQLLTLAAVGAAVADAGWQERDLPRARTAVILGIGGGIADLGQQYAVRSALPTFIDPVPEAWLSRLATWTEDSFPGILPNVAAGRVANRFDLSGVNYTVDAACASSLAAVYLACRELESGTSDVVVVGGADTIQNPFAYLCFGKTHALSPRGRCAPFDQAADGIAISEGVAILLLKRLADAERDGDRIRAVIKGVAGSSDGRDRGLTAPRPEGQALALERAYAVSGISPATVGLVEAHGTGTVAGDKAELETLNRVFRSAGAGAETCALGSVKSMIGHTKSTAGMAGLIKATLALQHKVLPPTLHVSTPNEAARGENSPLYVNSEARPWLQVDSSVPRRAAVSSFGFGGTNFHAVLEEYTGEYLDRNREAPSRCWPSELLVWTGESRAELHDRVTRLNRALAQGARHRLRDLAYSTWVDARERGRMTLAMVVQSVEELPDQLQTALHVLQGSAAPSARASSRIAFAGTPLAHEGRTAFLFPGQGSQYPGMLADLAIHFGDVRKAFERASEVLAQRLQRPLGSCVFPPPRFRDEDRQTDRDALTATNVAQPALGAAAIALWRLLGKCGVNPHMAGGHSYGEYAALAVAGAFDEAALYRLSEDRGRCMAETTVGQSMAMAAVATDLEHTRAVVDAIRGLWVANVNAPAQIVISGTEQAVDGAIDRFSRAGIVARRLPVSCAFHSPLMASARERFARTLQGTELRAPRLPVYSNVSAAAYPTDPAAMAELLSGQIVSPVRFVEEIEAMYAAGARIFVEAGPGRVLSGLVDQILATRPHVAVPLDARDGSGIFQLQHALAVLASHGVAVDLDPLFAGRDARVVDLHAFSSNEEERLSPTTWIVTGGSAAPLRPAKASAAARTPMPSPMPDAIAAPQAPSIPWEPTMPKPASDAVTTPETAGDTAHVMSKFQQLMVDFLETQKQVMLAYLNGSDTGDRGDTLALQLPTAAPVTTPSARPAQAVATAPPAVTEPQPGPVPTPVQTPAKSTSLESEDFTDVLLSIVSERTGYPTDLLGLDLNIEADLGIDSIKRVEIVGEFSSRALRGSGIELNDVLGRLTRSKTLRSIADTARELTGGALSAEPVEVVAPHALPERATDIEVAPQHLPRFVLAEVDARLPAAAAHLAPDDLVLITDDEHGIAPRVAAALRATGAHVAIMGAGTAERMSVRIDDFTDAQVVTQCVASIRAQHGRPITGIVNLRSLRSRSARDAAESARMAEQDVISLLHLARAAAPDLASAASVGRGWLFAATAANASPADSVESALRHGAIAGFVKTLAIEWPHVRCKSVHLDVPVPEMGQRLAEEIVAAPDFVEVAWRGSRRLTSRPVPADLAEDGERQLAIDSDAVLLITGGARGITAAIATDIARRYRPTLVILGRTDISAHDERPQIADIRSERELKAALLAEARHTGQHVSAANIDAMYQALIHRREARANLDAMKSLGARVDYRKVDVVDDQALAAAIDDVYGRYGRVDGVIHGAGVIEDALIENKTADSLARVFTTKARAAATLARCIRPESLQFLVMFSSVAGCFGNRGQADYAAANEGLNKLAVELDRRWPGRVVALNWGPWASSGMASASVLRELGARGMTAIDTVQGCLAFDRELRSGRKGQVEIVLGRGEWAHAAAPASAQFFDVAERSAVYGN